MKKVADSAAFFFIVAVAILTLVSILGIWEFFARDVIYKSFETLGLLASVAVIVIVAVRFADGRKSTLDANGQPVPMPMVAPNPGFTMIRHMTLSVLVVSVVLLTLIGVLAIWEVLHGAAVGKSLASIGIVAFSAFVIVLTCLEREDHKLLRGKNSNSISIGSILGILVLVWIFFSMMSSVFYSALR